jgi:hypothetical protein
MPSAIGDQSATVTLDATGATVPAGRPANFNFNISQYGAFTGTVTMSCTNLPTYASCTFTPAIFSAGSTPTPVTLSISTQQTVQASHRPRSELPGWPLAALFALPMASRRVHRHLRKGYLLLWLMLIFAGTFALNGCGGSGNNSNPPATTEKTSAGSYTLTVVATSGTLSHSTNVIRVVQ